MDQKTCERTLYRAKYIDATGGSYRIREVGSSYFARPEVTAHRILVVVALETAIEQCFDQVDNRMLASYRVCRYFLLYLLRQALEFDEEGRGFCASPDAFLTQANARASIRTCATIIVEDIIIDLNAEVRERAEAGTPFNYKRDSRAQKLCESWRATLSRDTKRRFHAQGLLIRARVEEIGNRRIGEHVTTRCSPSPCPRAG
jgi:hypothetical protein